MAHLKQGLQELGHQVTESTIRRLLQTLGYSLRANKKSIEGDCHPDRDAQFGHIKEQCQLFQRNSSPSCWPITHLPPASGTRLNIGSFLSFPSIGAPNHLPRWRSSSS